MNIALLGFAGQGQAAYDYWNKGGNEITICDLDESIQLPSGVKSELGENYLQNLGQFDLLVRTPGLHPKDIQAANPDQPKILDKVTTVTNEFLKVCPSKNVIGVTGTKGKGTTSTLIAKMLEAGASAGQRKVHLGGNIGTPPLELLSGAGALHGDAMQGAGEAQTEPYERYGEGALEPGTQQSTPSSGSVTSSAGQQARAVQSIQPDDWVVLELANFQLIDLKTSPHIGVCLMVVPEHLDWHGDTNEYITAKQQLFAHQTADDLAIYYGLNDLSQHVASVSPGQKIPFMKNPGADVIENKVTIDGQTICDVSEIKLLGKHNWQNVCAAVTTVWQVDKNVEVIKSVLTSFTGLEHRLEFVKDVGGVKYYDDSFGTTPETAVVAIEAFTEPKVVILGGSDKGASYNDLADALIKNNVRSVVIIGETGPAIEAAIRSKGFTNIVQGGKTMPEIVQAAQKQAQSGDIVLLSTGCASFDLFKDYQDRGEQFKKAVLALV